MLNGFSFDETTNTRLAVVDGEVVWLPTLAGLLRGDGGIAPAPRRDLWSALTAASATDAAFDRLEQQLAEGRELADVIEMDAWRHRDDT
ncbi:MAG: hypothetical protein ACI8TP_000729 [Acidimicrobiales bacterium]|jgi:hypothetical protein